MFCFVFVGVLTWLSFITLALCQKTNQKLHTAIYSFFLLFWPLEKLFRLHISPLGKDVSINSLQFGWEKKIPYCLSWQMIHTIGQRCGVNPEWRHREHVSAERKMSWLSIEERCCSLWLTAERKRVRQARVCCRLGRHFKLFHLCLLQSLGFGPSVLEPDLYLCFSQAEGAGELSTLCDGEVLLLTKLALQRQKLSRCEWSARLTIRLVLSERTCARNQVSCNIKEITNYSMFSEKLQKTIAFFFPFNMPHGHKINSTTNSHLCTPLCQALFFNPVGLESGVHNILPGVCTLVLLVLINCYQSLHYLVIIVQSFSWLVTEFKVV